MFTLQIGNWGQNPAGYEDVITGDHATVLERYYQFSHAKRCTALFRVIDIHDQSVIEMDVFQRMS